ncbi:hypothetical protein [Aeromicrobium sp. UC242_57]|uniref:hypothetical protein n=1 Tax=Aeromicrobium sp. UC242_57 TaxID=3374624 RepID=UPI0037BACE91
MNGSPLTHVMNAVRLELALYRSIGRWLARRPDVPDGATPIGYAQLVAPMLWLWIFGSATEAIVVEVLLRHFDAPWAEAIRLPLLVVGIWGVLWMIGMMAAYRVRPHLLSEANLRIRNSARTWVDVPLNRIASVHTVEHELPGIIKAVHQDDKLLLVGVSARTNLELRLDGIADLRTSGGDVAASRVGLWVDEPRSVRTLLQTHLPTAT